VSAKGESPTRRPRGRRGYTVARPRSNRWLWILNAIVIGFVVIAAAAASTRIGHTAVSATYHFLLYYVGVLALIALTAEVGIGLVATDRIFMKPAGRVTMQAIHRAVGFGAISFLVVHIVLEILAGRSSVLDAVIPFLYQHKTFYLGIGTLASDMFIVVMMLGIYRARLATRMSPLAWRLLHGTAYVAWIFGLIHGLLGGRPAKSFFGYSGFVYWAYGVCVAAVAVALLVRFVAKDRAGNEMASQPVAESPAGAAWPAAALASATLPGTMISATALPGSGPAALEGRPAAGAHRQAGAGQRGRPQLALPAGSSATQPGQSRTTQYARAGQAGGTQQYQHSGPFEHTGPFNQLDSGYPAGALDQLGGDHPSGPFSRPPFGPPAPRYERTGDISLPGRPHRQTVRGQDDWIAAYQRPLGVQRPVLPADHPSAPFDQPQFDQPLPRYERTGEIDLSGQYGPVLPADHPSAPFARPQFGDPLGAGTDGPGRGHGQPAQSGRFEWSMDPDPQDAQYRPTAGADWTGRYGRGESGAGQYGTGQYGAGRYGTVPPGGYDRPDHSGRFGLPYHRDPSPAYGQPSQFGPPPGYSDPPQSAASLGQPSPMPDPRDAYMQYRNPAGPGQPGRYPPPYLDQPDPAAEYGWPSEADGPGRHTQTGYAAPDPGAQYDRAAHLERSAQFERDRAAHYASFAEQDASYTRPRPPGLHGDYGPQDDTDPLDIVPLNTRNLS